MAADTPLTPPAGSSSKPKKRRPRAFGRPPVHGVRRLTRVLQSVPINLLDKRSAVGVAVRRFREDLIRDLGGDVTRAQLVLIEAAAKTWIIAQAAEDYILRQDTLVVDGALLHVVLQREQLMASLARLLTALGLERRAADGNDAQRALLEIRQLREAATSTSTDVAVASTVPDDTEVAVAAASETCVAPTAPETTDKQPEQP